MTHRPCRCLVEHGHPVVHVGLDAVLNVAQFGVEFCTDGARLAVLGDDVALLALQVVDAADGADDGCRAAGAGFLEGLQFLFRNLSTLYLQTQVERQLLQTAVGDGGQDGRRFGRDVLAVLDAEEVGCATFVDVLLLLGIEVKLARVACLVGNVVGAERSGVVAAHLIAARAQGCGAVVLADDDVVVCGEAALK